MEPIPVGAIVDYHGSQQHGRYKVIGHRDPYELFPGESAKTLDEAYPDGVAYEIWVEGVLVKFGNRDYSVHRVRRKSLTVVRLP